MIVALEGRRHRFRNRRSAASKVFRLIRLKLTYSLSDDAG
jgi:hypothetical protein